MRYLVSSCLAGFPCRYDGKSNQSPFVTQLVDRGLAHPICPEQLGGLSTPRPACEIRIKEDKTLAIETREGFDRTDAFVRGAQATLAIAKALHVEAAILKCKSPSCGRDSIYDGSFSGHLIPGRGVTADLLMANGIQVFTEEEEAAFNENVLGHTVGDAL